MRCSVLQGVAMLQCAERICKQLFGLSLLSLSLYVYIHTHICMSSERKRKMACVRERVSSGPRICLSVLQHVAEHCHVAVQERWYLCERGHVCVREYQVVQGYVSLCCSMLQGVAMLQCERDGICVRKSIK